MKIFQWTRIILILGVLGFIALPRDAVAGKPKPSSKAAHGTAPAAPAASAQAENDDADEPEGTPLPWKIGPAKIDLGHDLALDLKPEHRYLPPAAASEVLRSEERRVGKECR